MAQLGLDNLLPRSLHCFWQALVLADSWLEASIPYCMAVMGLLGMPVGFPESKWSERERERQRENENKRASNTETEVFYNLISEVTITFAICSWAHRPIIVKSRSCLQKGVNTRRQWQLGGHLEGWHITVYLLIPNDVSLWHMEYILILSQASSNDHPIKASAQILGSFALNQVQVWMGLLRCSFLSIATQMHFSNCRNRETSYLHPYTSL